MNSQEQMGIYKELEQKGWLNNSDTYRAKKQWCIRQNVSVDKSI